MNVTPAGIPKFALNSLDLNLVTWSEIACRVKTKRPYPSQNPSARHRPLQFILLVHQDGPLRITISVRPWALLCHEKFEHTAVHLHGEGTMSNKRSALLACELLGAQARPAADTHVSDSVLLGLHHHAFLSQCLFRALRCPRFQSNC